MSPEEIDKILQRYLNNTCTPGEKELVEQWFDAIGAKEKEELDPVTRQAIQKRIWSSLRVAKSAPNRYTQVARIAASILLLAVCTFFLYRYIAVSLPAGQTIADAANDLVVVKSNDTEKSVSLSDGSVVTLKPHSELRFPTVFGDKREVHLSGEALFQVARNVHHPFLVYANEVTTRVLGTSFLIKAYAQEPEVTVTVKTGKVSVYTEKASTNADKQEIILTPNQQIVYHRNENQTVKMLVNEPQAVSQQPLQKISYTNMPVTEIFHALEERYGIPIEFDEAVLAGCTLTYADLNEEGLYGQIEIICNALGARYKKSESSIVIEAGGCR